MAESFFNILIDGKIVKGIPGETILELARRHEIEIPTLCNDDRLEPFTSCYLCVVEVEGLKGHQPACSTRISEGMKIITYSEGIHKSRKMALELILSNHYADCLAPCKQTCPAGVDVQGYISLIEKGMYSDAVALIKETNPLPAICGRVCVRPCEAECRRNFLGEGAPVGIDYLKRFASDYDLGSPGKFVPDIKPATGKKVAVIGAGPGGLSAAYFLQVEGHQADIFEAAPKSGGWLRYGIPEYRLPNDILDQEVRNIVDLGVNIYYNKKLGENLSYREIKEKYDATILTIGSQKGTGVGCEGDDAENVFSGIDFLKNMEMTGQRYDFSGKTIAVIGGGNTAMDCCRTSIRCNAEKVYVIYRRTEKEMPANPIEIHESKLEGVEYMFLTLPKKIHKDENGRVRSMTCIRMELGEPDASGRRRPVPVEGSDFELEIDYIFAAIGQKTDVNFIEDVNSFAGNGQLMINKWGDIDAQKETLQTGIPSVFAAGDGVTGPATIIEAIAQAKIAANSADQFLAGLPIKPLKKTFISRRDNFKKQVKEDYLDRYTLQLREEMPTLSPDKRNNFDEVELGYSTEEIAKQETLRCLECGCTAFFDCDLQKYSTEYDAVQKTYSGEFREYLPDFRHPYIEIDNSKCILCARCVRICREVVGANALGFVNRGFDTYVAPSMGDALQDTRCESCGMCLSTCPTGALAENVIFKPGPLKTESVVSICNYCSVGCTLAFNHKNGFITGVDGKPGVVNREGNLCRYGKFGYNYMNRSDRVLQPLLKENGKFRAVSFEEAYGLIREKISSAAPEENAFFAGARLTNEELFLIQKLARAGVKTGNVSSFHYLGRGLELKDNWKYNVPFDDLGNASHIYIIGTEINQDHGVVGFMANNARVIRRTPISMISCIKDNSMKHKVDEFIHIASYYYFIKAMNYYLLLNGLENRLFLDDRVEGFEDYRHSLLSENFEEILVNAGISGKEIFKEFTETFNREMNAIIIFSEKEISGAAGTELFNLAMITGKLGKTSNGIISLKEKNNSQGLFDMGIHELLGPGGIPIDDPVLVERLKEKWHTEYIPVVKSDLLQQLEEGTIRNMFVFGEDPVGCAVNGTVNSWFSKAEFKVVQDYFMTPTALEADLVLPASFPSETGGSFTNAQKVIQEFSAVLPVKAGRSNLEQLTDLLDLFGISCLSIRDYIFEEIISLLPQGKDHSKIMMHQTKAGDDTGIFNHGCDAVVRMFAEEFENRFQNKI